MSEDIIFEKGGRYRNRFGWYEVLYVSENDMRVRYESDGKEQVLDFEMQRRILSNIESEETSAKPYQDDDSNRRYFITLGYLVRHGFIEAIIPPDSKNGFDNNYYRVKNHYPSDGQSGYYVHHDNVDKWGVEMRLSFKIPSNIPADELIFGSIVRIVNSPNESELRINNNTLCWRLLEIGFDLGANHNLQIIEQNVPEQNRNDFRTGTKIT